MFHFENPGIEHENTEDVDAPERRADEYEAAGLTAEEQAVYDKYIANVKKYADDLSTWRGIVKIRLSDTFFPKELYTEREKELISSANDKLLELQKMKATSSPQE